jgi:hypothetical protein
MITRDKYGMFVGSRARPMLEAACINVICELFV